MTASLRLGMLTPSSNTVLEPLTAAMLGASDRRRALPEAVHRPPADKPSDWRRALPEAVDRPPEYEPPAITAHFARFRVVAIDMGEGSRAQFDTAPVLAAAELLADAKVHAICWNGTSGSWLGLEQDRALCAAITARTGIPATTATLALMRAVRALGARRIGLVTPYLAAVQRAIAARWAEEEGLEVVAERHLEDPGNFSFAGHEEAVVARLVREVAAERPEAIAIHCTNFRGGLIAPGLEAELGIPVLDSVAVSLWGAIGAAGGDAAPLRQHGRVFALPW